VANGVVYTGDRTGEVYAFNATTGVFEWSYATGGAIDSSVAVAGDRASDAVAFVGCSTGVSGQTCTHSLFALNAENGGSALWTEDTGGSVDNPPIIADAGSGSGTGAVYVPSDGRTFAYALPTSN
jgi:outer membrane protein assembly factor BamB